MKNCAYCNSDHVDLLSENEVITYKGVQLDFVMEFSLCNECGRDFLTKEQIQSNDARLRDAKKSVDGLLSSSEIYSARTKLGLTQDQASLVFGGGKNAFSKYERAEVSQSAAMDKLIRICLRHPNVFSELLISSGVKSKKFSFEYEDNVVSYSRFKAANEARTAQSRFKSVTMRDLEYGQVVN